MLPSSDFNILAHLPPINHFDLHPGLTGRRGGDFAVIPLVPQCRDGLGLRCAVAGAGVGHHTLCRAGCRSRDNAVVVIMAEGGSIVALLGQVLVLVADVDGVALLGAGRGDGLALVPCLIQHLNVLGAGLAAVFASVIIKVTVSRIFLTIFPLYATMT